jgi:hypothetical protein
VLVCKPKFGAEITVELEEQLESCICRWKYLPVPVFHQIAARDSQTNPQKVHAIKFLELVEAFQ